MDFHSDGSIELQKQLSELDRFTIEFITILRRHTDYVLVSGYVSILLGRSRGSEDIDVLVPPMQKDSFISLTKDLSDGGFYCLNTDSVDEAFEILGEAAIRFAKNGTAIPNMVMKFLKKDIDRAALEGKIKVILDNKFLFVSPLELQIVYKERMLKSPKDMEDAKHLRLIAKDNLNRDKMKMYEAML
jgi:hypothetical protein